MSTIGALAALSAAAVVATAASTAASAGGPWALLRRPLQLPRLAAGARCPVTPVHRLDRGRILGLGRGPVHPGVPSFGADGLHPGRLVSKTLWVWPPALRTHRERVLVRGRRLDGAGKVRFQLGPHWSTAPVTSELRLDTTRTVGTFGGSDWGTTITHLLVRAPGCYGLQIDSASGTRVVVVRVAPR